MFLSNVRCVWQTTVHKFWVSWYTLGFCWRMLIISLKHDFSKYKKDEREGFASIIGTLGKMTYPSNEYRNELTKIAAILTLHYKRNSHHPEHHTNRLYDMNILEIIEMAIDWRAAVRRMKNGNIYKSIEFNEDRFSILPEQKKDLYLILGLGDLPPEQLAQIRKELLEAKIKAKEMK